MQSHHKRTSWAQDSALATFTLVLAALFIAPVMTILSWREAFAILLVPTLLLCRYARYRAAAIAAGIALLAGTLFMVPPRWSLRLDMDALWAIAIFATAAAVAITATRASERRAGPSATGSNAQPLDSFARFS